MRAVLAFILAAVMLATSASADIIAGGGGASSGGGSGTGATVALDNLSAVSVNSALVPQTAIDLGAQTTPYRYNYLYGAGTFGSGSFRLGGTPSGHIQISFPSITGELLSTASSNQSINGAAMTLVAGGGIKVNNGYIIYFGSGFDALMSFYTTQTPSTLMVGYPATSNSVVFAEAADIGFNFGHALRLYPMVYHHSQSQSQTKYFAYGHNDTDGLLEIGSGGLKVNVAQCSGSSSLCIGGNTTAASTQTYNNALAIGDNARAWNATAVAIGTGAIAQSSSSMAIGGGANVLGDGAIAIGTSAAASAGQLVFGRPDTFNITQAFLGGSGATSAAPVSYAVKGSGGSGTNIVAADMFMDGGASTGNAAPARSVLRSGALGGASGTTAQTMVPRLTAGVAKTLTNNTVTTVASATLALDSSVVLMFDCSAEAIDAAHVVQHDAGTVTCSVTNSNGTIANNACSAPSNVRNVATSGTLVTTWTITAANPALVQVNVNSSLTPSTGYPRFTCNVANLTQQAVTFP